MGWLIYIYIYIYIYIRGDHGVMVIVIGNIHDKPSANTW